MNGELEEAGESPVGLEDDENSAEDEQESQKPDESEEDEPEESDEDEEEESEEETEDESEDEEEETGEESEDEEREEEVESHEPRKHVPLRRYQNDVRRAREETEYWKNRALEAGPANAADEHQESDKLKETIRSLAQSLKTPEEETEKLVTTILDLAKAQAIPPELQARLERFEKSEKQIEMTQRFSEEWNGFLPAIRKEYPNATPEQLELAREAMDIIAHSRRFHSIPDLEYIFTKAKDDFEEILFSPKKKGFETSRVSGTGAEREGSQKQFRIPEPNDVSPESIAALESFLESVEEAEGGHKIKGNMPDGTPYEIREQ